jgi:hypothetical protein
LTIVLVTWNTQPFALWIDGEHVSEVNEGDIGVIRTVEPSGKVPPARDTEQVSDWPPVTAPFGPGPEQYLAKVI